MATSADRFDFSFVHEVERDTQGWAALASSFADDDLHLFRVLVVVNKWRAGLAITYYGLTKRGERSRRASSEFWSLDDTDTDRWLFALVPHPGLRSAITDLASLRRRG